MNTVPLNEVLLPHFASIVAIAGGCILILTVWLIIISIKMSRTTRYYRNLMRGMDGQNLEELLTENINKVRIALEKVNETDLACKQLEQTTGYCLQKLGVVRFNAFENVGSDLSFAVAFLDQHKDGVVISGLYSRDDCRVYAKPIKAGMSSYILTAEEKEAIEKALHSGRS